MLTEQELTESYQKHTGPLYAYVSRRVGGDRVLAEDVVQDTWLRSLGSWRKHGIPDFLGDQVRELVAGTRSPKTLQCCHSGCSPCAQDILGCAARIIEQLSKPPRRFGLF